MITQKELKKILRYDKQTGIFVWRVSKGKRVEAGDVAGSINNFGYLHIQINNKNYKAHRLAWLYVYGEMPKNQIDHKNRNRADNRIKNLRCATNQENSRNRGKNSNNTSGVTGVHWSKKASKWTSNIYIDGIKIHLGYFVKFSDAVDARKNAEIQYKF